MNNYRRTHSRAYHTLVLTSASTILASHAVAFEEAGGSTGGNTFGIAIGSGANTGGTNHSVVVGNTSTIGANSHFSNALGYGNMIGSDSSVRP